MYVLSDINFAGVTDEEQKAIIINFSKVLKTIPCRFSFSVANEHVDEKAFHEKVLYRLRNDKYDDLRRNYNRIIKEKDKHNFEEMMNHTTLTVSAEKVMKDENECFSLEVEEGLVKGITLTDLNEKSATIELDEKKVYKVVTPEGEELTLSGAEIAKKMDERRKEHISKAAGRGR